MLTKRLILLWQQSWRSRQTKYLALGLSSFCGAYLIWLGLRPVVVITGAMICLVTLLVWPLLPSPTTISTDSDDLLDPKVFFSQLDESLVLPGACLDDTALHYWQQTYAQAEAIHRVAVAIAHKDAFFIPDLFDTLHTVLGLSAQFSQAFDATQQLKTLLYQKVAQQQLLASSHRLSQTHYQLQELHDQLLVNGMERASYKRISAVSTTLQTLIQNNKSGLTATHQVSLH